MNSSTDFVYRFKLQYYRDDWIRFLKDKLPVQILEHSNFIISEIVGNFSHLGFINLIDNKKLGIYEIKTTSVSSCTSYNELIKNKCKKHKEDGAIVTCYDDKNQWCISFISIEDDIPKSYTYTLGRNSKVDYVIKRFKQLKQSSTFDDIKNIFSIEPLNKEFYLKLFKWYENVKSDVIFPDNGSSEKDTYTSTSLIRLLMRLLFVCFLKEKNLVNKDFFELSKLKNIIDWNEESSYYKAILQNLFFATLNCEISNRSFITDKNNQFTNLYRYKDIFLQKDEKSIIKLFEKTPFLNGGIFECMDKIDGFSDNIHNKLKISNKLFFNNNDNNPGLIDIFNQYEFTVKENSLFHTDIALEPEVLGMIFENLLMVYNTESNNSIRKQTGSYYTPREIVSYMVDESLKAYLISNISPHDDDIDSYRKRIDNLFLTSSTHDISKKGSESNILHESEISQLINIIKEIKILDPAVGSGAFPMGMLHRLVSLLSFIDPDNQRWEQKQINTINEIEDSEYHKQMLDDVHNIFDRENYYKDFARKFYLIQNNIYGVDIQPIAIQIAKMRFFISLLIEQKSISSKRDNYGIKPLPNLDIKFIAANTLIGLDKPKQIPIRNPEISYKEKEIKNIHNKYFTIKTLKTKSKYIKEDEKLRKQLYELLVKDGWQDKIANQITKWDPYDQDTSADWYDSEWMFGINNGFNIVIGNPPYIQLQKNNGKLGNLYKDAGYETFVRTGDIYQLFYEKGCKLLSPNDGVLSYITSNSWLKANYGKTTRNYFFKNHTPLCLVEVGTNLFKNVIVECNILILRNGKSGEIGKAINLNNSNNKIIPSMIPSVNFQPQLDKPWSILSDIEHSVMNKMETIGDPLIDWDVKINYGTLTGCNEAFIIDNATKEELVSKDSNSAKIIKPIFRGKDVKRYKAQWAGIWLIYALKGIIIKDYPAVYEHLLKHEPKLSKKAGNNKWYELQASGINIDEMFSKDKLLWMNLSNKGNFTYNQEKIYCNDSVCVLTIDSSIYPVTLLKYLCALLNSNICFWFMQNTARTSGAGALRWEKMFVKHIPIPKISTIEQQPFIELVDYILKAKKIDTNANTDKQEMELDKMVYELYGLNDKEVKTIDKRYTTTDIVNFEPQLDKPWSILSDIEHSVMNKMETLGIPLKNLNIKLNSGVGSGCNEAFIIDNNTKETLVREDPNSAKIIKPILRGRDINQYKAQWAEKWLIYALKGIIIKDYPVVYQYLLKHKTKLSKKAGNNKWYELQASPSDKLDKMFTKEKLFWARLSNIGKFSYSEEEIYCNEGTSLLTNISSLQSIISLKYLCGLLNSSLITWYIKHTGQTTGMGLLQWANYKVEDIHIPKISISEQQPFIKIVDNILSTKQDNPLNDTSKQEEKLDKLIYRLYNLTSKEIELIQNIK